MSLFFVMKFTFILTVCWFRFNLKCLRKKDFHVHHEQFARVLELHSNWLGFWKKERYNWTNTKIVYKTGKSGPLGVKTNLAANHLCRQFTLFARFS